MKRGVLKVIFGGLMLLTGGVIGPLLVLLLPLFTTENLARLAAPGRVDFRLEESVSLTLWYDQVIFFDGTRYDSGPLRSNWNFLLIEKSTGEERFPQSALKMTKSYPDHEALAIGRFQNVRPGEYTLQVSGEGGQRVFSLSTAPYDRKMRPMLIGGGLSTFVAVLGGAVLILGIVQLTRKSP